MFKKEKPSAAAASSFLFIFPELIAKMEKRKDATEQPPDETSD